VTRQQRMGEQSRLSTWPDVNVLSSKSDDRRNLSRPRQTALWARCHQQVTCLTCMSYISHHHEFLSLWTLCLFNYFLTLYQPLCINVEWVDVTVRKRGKKQSLCRHWRPKSFLLVWIWIFHSSAWQYVPSELCKHAWFGVMSRIASQYHSFCKQETREETSILTSCISSTVNSILSVLYT
jgi:hypothetical protein